MPVGVIPKSKMVREELAQLMEELQKDSRHNNVQIMEELQKNSAHINVHVLLILDLSPPCVQ